MPDVLLTVLSRPTKPDGRKRLSLLSLSSGRKVSRHSSIFAVLRQLTVSAPDMSCEGDRFSKAQLHGL